VVDERLRNMTAMELIEAVVDKAADYNILVRHTR
jgi:hypothetical protein